MYIPYIILHMKRPLCITLKTADLRPSVPNILTSSATVNCGKGFRNAYRYILAWLYINTLSTGFTNPAGHWWEIASHTQIWHIIIHPPAILYTRLSYQCWHICRWGPLFYKIIRMFFVLHIFFFTNIMKPKTSADNFFYFCHLGRF